jgi:peroxiredoxin-like protein
MEPHAYNVSVEWNSERKGTMTSPELTNAIEVATPPNFPAGMEGIWSPEHLFTAAVASCLMTTFLAIAENSKLKFASFKVNSKGILEQIDGKFLMTRVELYPVVVIHDENDRARIERILHKSESACLISNSVKATVSVNAIIQLLPTPN